MTIESHVSVYRCDEPDCTAFSLGRPTDNWWLGRGNHWCPDHRIRECRRCYQRMRPTRSKAEDWPGTRRYGGRAMCATCLEVTRNGKAVQLDEPPESVVRYLHRTLKNQSPEDRQVILDALGIKEESSHE